jgi:glycosyltransferase involved in cell wall biosynthesis
MRQRQIDGSDSRTGLRVAYLTNLIPPYHKPLFALLSKEYSPFRLFLSTAMEANRPWLPEWSGLDVVVQRGLAIRRKWRHPVGFEEPAVIHLPLDTYAQLARFKPDVIVSAEMGLRTLLACVYAKLHRRCRLLIWSEVTQTTEDGRGALRMILRRFLAKRADGFLALGAGGVGYIQSLGVDRGKIFRIAYSTGLSPFLEIAVERHGFYATRLLFSGQLIARKGLTPFLEVLGDWAARHPERQIEFRLLGNGPERDSLGALPLPLNVKLVFIGTVQYNQLPAVYAESGIFVLPTLADTWGVAVNEALASGLPVLGSVHSQAVEEMVEDGRNGWTFRPENRDEMQRALDEALSVSEAELNQMRVAARQSALRVTPEQTAAVFGDAVRAVTRTG